MTRICLQSFLIKSRLVKLLASLTTLFLSLTFSISAPAKTLHEGWYKIISGKQHVGYLIQRYSFDDKKRQYQSVYFMRTNALGGNLIESLEAVSTDTLQPVSYKFSSVTDKEKKIIDAVVTEAKKKDKSTSHPKKQKKNEPNAIQPSDLKLDIMRNDQTTSLTKKIRPDSFFSTFLTYYILRSQGLKVGNNKAYSAIAEEDGEEYIGQTAIVATQKVAGVDTFRILNSFKGSKFVSSIALNGDVISTRAPESSIETVKTTDTEAIGKIPFAEKSIKLLFGGELPKSEVPPAGTLTSGPPSPSGSPVPTPSAKPSPSSTHDDTTPENEIPDLKLKDHIKITPPQNPGDPAE